MKVVDCVSEVHDQCHDRAGRRDVYLTFDDGSNPLCTPDALDVPAEHRVPATFCVIGAYVEDQPKLIQRVIDEGHEIANHTMTHPDLSRCEPDEVRAKYWTRTGSSGWRVPRPQFGICVPLTEYGRTKWSLKWQRRGWRLLTGR
ncbi:polysaccharide deacetylase family protein [Paraburkholderia sp. MM5477-R1]|uniref:polysaccharide deacetylase family protein n=1 Tax=Paraburkholderia sp. MM5477-R1 TaxID=2991062 RepID=UPI003D1F06A4